MHSVATGPANEADITRLDDVLHGEETELYGDQAYWSEDHRLQCKHAGIRYRGLYKNTARALTMFGILIKRT